MTNRFEDLPAKYLRAARCNRERAKRYSSKMKVMGFKQMHLWVHVDDAAMVKAMTADLLEKRRSEGDA